jgi:hypothetical protein
MPSQGGRDSDQATAKRFSATKILADILPTILHFDSLTALVELVEGLDSTRQKEAEGGVP